MKEQKKRRKGVENAELKGRIIYRLYKKYCKTQKIKPEREPLYSKIRNSCNQKIIQKILEGDTFKLPRQLGYLFIKKIDNNLHLHKHGLIDFKKSKDANIKILFDNPYVYSWKWFKKNSKFRFKGMYKFIASRKNKRAVAKRIKGGFDYYRKPDLGEGINLKVRKRLRLKQPEC